MISPKIRQAFKEGFKGERKQAFVFQHEESLVASPEKGDHEVEEVADHETQQGSGGKGALHEAALQHEFLSKRP